MFFLCQLSKAMSTSVSSSLFDTEDFSKIEKWNFICCYVICYYVSRSLKDIINNRKEYVNQIKYRLLFT